MSVAWIESRKRAIVVSPRQGATDGPTQPYPTARPNGRGPHRPVLPHRRRLRPPQPQGEALRIHKAACRLGGHNPRPPAAAAGRGVRALLLARCPAVLLPPVPRGRGASHPSSLHRRVRKLRRFLEPLRREVVRELVGDPETLLVDSTLLAALHPRQVTQSAGLPGAGWVRWGSFSVYGVKLHLLCATKGVPISYELTPANVAEVVRLTEELINEANLTDDLARRLLGDLAYRSEAKRSVGPRLGRVRDLPGDREGRPARPEAAHRDRPFEPQAGVRARRDAGDDPGGSGEQDRGEDLRLHLRLSRKSPPGPTTRAHQGTMGVNLTTHI